jgi:hypothetical protein
MTLLVTYDNVTGALLGEKVLKDSGVPCNIVPVPRSLGDSCNYALDLAAGNPEPVLKLLREKGALYVKVFCRDERGGYVEKKYIEGKYENGKYTETNLHELCFNVSH